MADIPYIPGAEQTGGGFSFENLLKDRNFLSLLAGTGARLGAGGAGEAIGVPTQQYIQSLAAQEAAGKQGKRQTQYDQLVSSVLAALTPAGMPGPTSLKASPGKLSVDLTPPAGQVGTPSVSGAPAASPTAAPTGTAPQAGNANNLQLAMSLIPFLTAPQA